MPPLHRAALLDDVAAARGADTEVKDNRKRTPAKLAAARGHGEIAEIIEGK